MKTYATEQNFKVVVSTKATLIGAENTVFSVVYAPVNDLKAIVPVSGGLTETVNAVSVISADLTANAVAGSKLLFAESGHGIHAGDVIEYGTNNFAYVAKTTATKIYLKTATKVDVASGDSIIVAGNTGVYVTADIAIPTAGEYLVTIEAPEYNIIVEDRIRVVSSEGEAVTVDGDAPSNGEIAVAY